MKRKILLVINLLLLVSQVFAQITISVSRNPALLNESLDIIFTSDTEVNGKPDFSPLTQDFEIINQSNSNNISIINSKTTRSINWRLQVIPKKAGTVIIPPINFGNQNSQVATLTVDKTSTQSKQDQGLFIEVEVDNLKPMVQQQVIYTIKIYTKYRLGQANLNTPSAGNSLIEKLGEDTQYAVNLNSVRYTVIEQKYAIFPQQSGKVIINPAVLNAQVIHNNNAFNIFNNITGQPIRVIAKQIELQVQAIPNDFSGNHWLPSSEFLLQQKWSGDLNSMRVGEPLTRTLILTSKGNVAAQLPKLEITSLDFKTYPDEAKLNNIKNQLGVIGYREKKIAYIAKKSGKFTIPPIEIKWFDVNEQVVKIAKLPQTIIKAIANIKPQKPNPTIAVKQQPNIWFWLTIVFASLWLVTLAIVGFKNPTTTNRKNKPQINKNHTSSFKPLKQACKNNQAEVCKQYLLSWGKQKFAINNLSQLTANCSTNFATEIKILNKYLYSETQSFWHGENLWQAFVADNKIKQNKTIVQDEVLEPLHRLS